MKVCRGAGCVSTPGFVCDVRARSDMFREDHPACRSEGDVVYNLVYNVVYNLDAILSVIN